MSESIKNAIILMYHGVVGKQNIVPPDREIGADLYDVALDNFRAQMTYLKQSGYRVMTHRTPALDDGHSSAAVLTFDDGEMNNFTDAFPVLKEHEFPAYFFVIAKRVGKPGYMGLEELRALHSQGMIIGSHGLSHEILTDLLETQIREELSASKKFLEVNLGVEIDSLSIPRGFCNDQVLKLAYEAGYRTIFISERPDDLDAECCSRVAVKKNWSLKRFEQALRYETPAGEWLVDSIKNGVKKILGGGFYDWLRSNLLKFK